MSGPRPVVLSGPSGVGKSTLMKKLMKDYEGVFGFSVSRTFACQLLIGFDCDILSEVEAGVTESNAALESRPVLIQ